MEKYSALNAPGGAKAFEIVFVSGDTSEAKMLQYMQDKGCDWLAVAFDDKARLELKNKYGAFRAVQCCLERFSAAELRV